MTYDDFINEKISLKELEQQIEKLKEKFKKQQSVYYQNRFGNDIYNTSFEKYADKEFKKITIIIQNEDKSVEFRTLYEAMVEPDGHFYGYDNVKNELIYFCYEEEKYVKRSDYSLKLIPIQILGYFDEEVKE